MARIMANIRHLGSGIGQFYRAIGGGVDAGEALA